MVTIAVDSGTLPVVTTGTRLALNVSGLDSTALEPYTVTVEPANVKLYDALTGGNEITDAYTATATTATFYAAAVAAGLPADGLEVTITLGTATLDVWVIKENAVTPSAAVAPTSGYVGDTVTLSLRFQQANSDYTVTPPPGLDFHTGNTISTDPYGNAAPTLDVSTSASAGAESFSFNGPTTISAVPFTVLAAAFTTTPVNITYGQTPLDPLTVKGLINENYTFVSSGTPPYLEFYSAASGGTKYPDGVVPGSGNTLTVYPKIAAVLASDVPGVTVTATGDGDPSQTITSSAISLKAGSASSLAGQIANIKFRTVDNVKTVQFDALYFDASLVSLADDWPTEIVAKMRIKNTSDKNRTINKLRLGNVVPTTIGGSPRLTAYPDDAQPEGIYYVNSDDSAAPVSQTGTVTKPNQIVVRYVCSYEPDGDNVKVWSAAVPKTQAITAASPVTFYTEPEIFYTGGGEDTAQPTSNVEINLKIVTPTLALPWNGATDYDGNKVSYRALDQYLYTMVAVSPGTTIKAAAKADTTKWGIQYLATDGSQTESDLGNLSFTDMKETESNGITAGSGATRYYVVRIKNRQAQPITADASINLVLTTPVSAAPGAATTSNPVVFKVPKNWTGPRQDWNPRILNSVSEGKVTFSIDSTKPDSTFTDLSLTGLTLQVGAVTATVDNALALTKAKLTGLIPSYSKTTAYTLSTASGGSNVVFITSLQVTSPGFGKTVTVTFADINVPANIMDDKQGSDTAANSTLGSFSDSVSSNIRTITYNYTEGSGYNANSSKDSFNAGSWSQWQIFSTVATLDAQPSGQFKLKVALSTTFRATDSSTTLTRNRTVTYFNDVTDKNWNVKTSLKYTDTISGITFLPGDLFNGTLTISTDKTSLVSTETARVQATFANAPSPSQAWTDFLTSLAGKFNWTLTPSAVTNPPSTILTPGTTLTNADATLSALSLKGTPDGVVAVISASITLPGTPELQGTRVSTATTAEVTFYNSGVIASTVAPPTYTKLYQAPVAGNVASYKLVLSGRVTLPSDVSSVTTIGIKVRIYASNLPTPGYVDEPISTTSVRATYPTEQEVPSYTTTGTYSGVTKVDLVYVYPGNRTQLVADLVPSPQPALPNSAALGFAVGTAFPRQLSFAYTPTASDDTKAVAIFTKYGNEYYLLYFTFLNLASTFGANVSGDSPVLAITQLGFIESDINQQVAQLRKLYVGVLPLSSIGDVTGVDLSRASSPGPGQKWIGSIEATKTLPSQRFCLNDPASSSPQLGVFVASFVNGTVVNQGVKVANPPATLTEWSWTQTQGPAPSILTSGFPFTLQLHHEPLEAPEVSEIQEPASVELPTLPSYEDIAPWAPPSLFFPQVTPSTPAHTPSSRETLRNLV